MLNEFLTQLRAYCVARHIPLISKESESILHTAGRFLHEPTANSKSAIYEHNIYRQTEEIDIFRR